MSAVNTDLDPSLRVVDVIVVGSGAAGLSAALHAAERGGEVLILERGDDVGGTTARSHGAFWIPNNRWMAEAGIEDDRADALRYMARLSRPHTYRPSHETLGLEKWEHDLLVALYDQGSQTVGSLERKGLQVLPALDFPDYHLIPENPVGYGRTLLTAAPDGGMGCGADLVRQLHDAARAAGISVECRHRVRGVTRAEDGSVSGVIADTPHGSASFHASRGVIFASGGFGHNRELLNNFLSGPVFGSCAAPTNTGDFVTIAGTVDAPLRNMRNAWFAPCIFETWLRHGHDPDFRVMFAAPGDSMLFVNRYGERVLNEKGVYNELAQAFFGWDARRLGYPNLFQFMVWDQPCADYYTAAPGLADNPIADRGQGQEHVVRASTFDELGRALRGRLTELTDYTGGVALDDAFEHNLARTVQRFNRFADQGRDEDYHRGENPAESFLQLTEAGPPRNPEAPHMRSLSPTGPYYATLVVPGTLDTRGGPMIDAQGHVLGSDMRPIPGLFGAGNCVATAGQGYFGAGGTIGPAMIFGRAAGLAAMERSPEPTMRSAYIRPASA